MAKRKYVPIGGQNRRAWLTNLIVKLEPVASTLGVTPEELASLKADGAVYAHAVDAKLQFRTKAQEWTEYVVLTERGTGANQVPAPLVLDPPPPGVESGAFLRVAKLVNRIKTHGNYTTSIGKDLGIIGPEESLNMEALKPRLTVKLDNGRPVLSWSKKGAQGLEIQADRGTGAFVPAVFSLTTRHVDNAPLPPAGTGVVWKYRAIYRLKDSTVGQWSDDVSVGVFGADA